MLSYSPSYRFGPRRTGRLFAASLAAVVAFLAAPALAVWALPDPPAVREKVELSSAYSEWTEPIEHLVCEVDPYAMTGHGWNCGGATVLAASTEWTDDPERTLRRQVRAYNDLVDSSSGTVMAFGDNHIFFYLDRFTGPTIAMTVRGTGEFDEEVLFATVSGSHPDEVASVASQIWEGLTGTPMAQDVLAQLQDSGVLDDDPLPGRERPLRPMPQVQTL